MAEEYKSNSDKTRRQEAREKAEKVTTEEVRTAKRTELQKFKDKAMSEDAPRIKKWFVNDIAMPKIKKAIWDIVRDFLEGATQSALEGLDYRINGDTKWSRGRDKRGSDGRVHRSYDKYYDYDRDDYDRRDERRVRSPSRGFGAYDYGDLIFRSRGDAERVLDEMDNRIRKYDVVSVRDLYDMCDKDSDWTSDKYGWIDLNGAYVDMARGGGFRLVLPRAMPID